MGWETHMKKKVMILVFLLLALVTLAVPLLLKTPFYQNLADSVQLQEKPRPELPKTAASTEKIDYDFTYDFSAKKIDTHLTELKALYGVPDQAFAYFYYSPFDEEYLAENDHLEFLAGSTVKVPLAMYYYDQVRSGALTLDSLFEFREECYEVGGPIGETFLFGELIPLETILDEMIVNSDNSAIQILIHHLGGIYGYRDALMTYSNPANYTHDFIYSNLTSASYAFDVLNHLHSNASRYPELLLNMKQAAPTLCFKLAENQYPLAHKYGQVDDFLHDHGIVYTPEPYLIGVFTKGVGYSESLIYEVNRLFEEYTIYKLNQI